MKTFIVSAIIGAAVIGNICSCTTNDAVKEEKTNGSITAMESGNYPPGKMIFDDSYTATPLSDNPNQGYANKDGAPDKPSNSPVNITDENLLKRKFKNLLVFHADDTMQIKKSYLTTLIMAKNNVLNDVKTEVLESSAASDDKIYLDTTFDAGTKMKARLIDMNGSTEKGFEIEMLGGEESQVQGFNQKRDKIYWQWKITPLKAGIQELKLIVNVIEKDGETVNLPTRSIPVVIFAEKRSFLSAAGDYWQRNYQWLLSAIAIPIIIAIVTTKLKNK